MESDVSFLCLPLEVRSTIYEHLFDGLRIRPRIPREFGEILPILLAHKQLHDEVKDALLQRARIIVSGWAELNYLLEQVSTDVLGKIRHVEVSAGLLRYHRLGPTGGPNSRYSFYECEWKDCLLLATLPNLETVDFLTRPAGNYYENSILAICDTQIPEIRPSITAHSLDGLVKRTPTPIHDPDGGGVQWSSRYFEEEFWKIKAEKAGRSLIWTSVMPLKVDVVQHIKLGRLSLARPSLCEPRSKTKRKQWWRSMVSATCKPVKVIARMDFDEAVLRFEAGGLEWTLPQLRG